MMWVKHEGKRINLDKVGAFYPVNFEDIQKQYQIYFLFGDGDEQEEIFAFYKKCERDAKLAEIDRMIEQQTSCPIGPYTDPNFPEPEEK